MIFSGSVNILLGVLITLTTSGRGGSGGCYVEGREDQFSEYAPPREVTTCPRQTLKTNQKMFQMLLNVDSAQTTADSISTSKSSTSTLLTRGMAAIESKYHSDKSCDRVRFNAYKQSLARHGVYLRNKALGTVNTIPNEETIYCPMVPQQLQQHSTATTTPSSLGMDTIWIVENTASTPIVLSYLNQEGIEVSAVNPKISPPHHDPYAIVQPGQYKPIYTYEGHIFYARSYNILTHTMGPVLLQHRVGLIPVGEKFLQSNPNFVCPIAEEDDIEPRQPTSTGGVVLPEYARTRSPTPLKPCYALDIGFRNVLNCPLHAYYVTKSMATQEQEQSNDEKVTDDMTLMCHEQFKFHLGMQHTNLPDYMWDWQSTVKYENSFMGHTFHFRLATPTSASSSSSSSSSNKNDHHLLVDTITFTPTYVQDCPIPNAGGVQEQVQNPVMDVGTSTSGQVFDPNHSTSTSSSSSVPVTTGRNMNEKEIGINSVNIQANGEASGIINNKPVMISSSSMAGIAASLMHNNSHHTRIQPAAVRSTTANLQDQHYQVQSSY